MVGTSPLWKHFDSVTYKGQKYARCKEASCESHSNPSKFVTIRHDASTSGLWRHLRAHHPDINEMEETEKEDKRRQAEKQKAEAADEFARFTFQPDS